MDRKIEIEIKIKIAAVAAVAAVAVAVAVAVATETMINHGICSSLPDNLRGSLLHPSATRILL